MSSGHGPGTSSLPIGVLLAADGAVRGNAVGTLTPPGGVRYPSAWEQERATPLPRRQPRFDHADVEDAPTGGHGLPRRREMRAPGGRAERSAGPRTPHTHPTERPHFPATLPPGVVRLDDQDPQDGVVPGRVAGADPAWRDRPTRHDRATLTDPHGTRMISRARRPGGGPVTGSLDIDADLFTPASERARQTPPGGISARHTPSAGLSLAHLHERAVTPAPAAPAPVTPSNGVYPRRRDLRRSGGAPVTGPVPMPPVAPAGLAFVPPQAMSAPCSGEIPLGSPLPRRRDLRNGVTTPAPAAERTEEAPAGEQRTGALAVGVARAAVMTMLVGVGYAVVSGHQLNVDTGDEPAVDSASAMMAAGPARSAAPSDWDVRGEVASVKAATDRQTEVRVAAARTAAAKVRAAKAAAAARAAQLATATRDAQRNPKAVAKMLAADRGWGSTQFTCLDLLWTRESNWNYKATNAYSGAYGIPQSLPGSKMASVASDWRTNPVTQIKWGLSYIADRYGTPCGAWAHSQSTGWY